MRYRVSHSSTPGATLWNFEIRGTTLDPFWRSPAAGKHAVYITGAGEHPDITDIAYNLDGSEPCNLVGGDCEPAGATGRDGLRAFDR